MIAKQLRQVPGNYSQPIPVPALESSLRGAIYDPYIRRTIWEGVGVGQGTGRWESEVDSWFSCPSSSSSSQSGPQLVLAAPKKRPPRGGEGPPQTSDSDTLCPYAWAAPVHKLNCGIVWPAGLDFSALDNSASASHEHHHCGSASVEEEMRMAWTETSGQDDLPNLDTPEYAGQIEKDWVIEKLLAQGGLRLAGVLNAVFPS